MSHPPTRVVMVTAATAARDLARIDEIIASRHRRPRTTERFTPAGRDPAYEVVVLDRDVLDNEDTRILLERIVQTGRSEAVLTACLCPRPLQWLALGWAEPPRRVAVLEDEIPAVSGGLVRDLIRRLCAQGRQKGMSAGVLGDARQRLQYATPGELARAAERW